MIVAAVSVEREEIFHRMHMHRMENQISEVNSKPCFISPLLLLLIVILVCISFQLSTELSQVREKSEIVKLVI